MTSLDFKFFLQILAGVTNSSIVKDPLGYINLGTQIRIPFELSEADIDCRVILLTDFPIVKLAVETPEGKIIDSFNATFDTFFLDTNNIQTIRFNLPIVFDGNKIQSGTWSALLEIDEQLYRKALTGELGGENHGSLVDLKSKGAKYCLSVHSFSNLRMSATISQNSFIPGSILFINAILTEYNLPVQKRARVNAELEYPDKTKTIIPLAEEEPGIFKASLIAILPGIYRFRILAEGGTYRNVPFMREQILNGAVFNMGDQPGSGIRPDVGDFCSLLKCLAEDKDIQRYLKENNINPKIIIKCIEENCMRTKT
jgi:hypothetical protein